MGNQIIGSGETQRIQGSNSNQTIVKNKATSAGHSIARSLTNALKKAAILVSSVAMGALAGVGTAFLSAFLTGTPVGWAILGAAAVVGVGTAIAGTLVASGVAKDVLGLISSKNDEAPKKNQELEIDTGGYDTHGTLTRNRKNNNRFPKTKMGGNKTNSRYNY